MTYRPKTLAIAPDADYATLVQAGKQHRLVLYLGAGVSMAPPACGPTGLELANRLRPFAARALDVPQADLEGLSLEALAQRVADSAGERLTELRHLAAETFDFVGMEPTYGHVAAALLLREGLVQLISVNWDCGVERAGTDIGAMIESVADARESLQLAHRLPVYKVHGCATRPPTLALTQAEVDRPQHWAIGRTQDAVIGGVIVFIGLGTVGLYVREPFQQLVDAWVADAATIRVADPELNEQWREVLGGRAEEVHVGREADEFFDELLRAVVIDALDRVEMAARELAQFEGWAQSMVAGFLKIRAALRDSTADAVLRWWRGGVVATQDGSPFVTALAGQRCLMTVALLAGMEEGSVEVSGVRGRHTVASERRYFEIVCRPGQHVSRVETVARERIRRRREEGTYTPNRSITVVISEAMGEVPAATAPTNIAAGDGSQSDIVDGVEATDIRFVAAEDAVRGRVAA